MRQVLHLHLVLGVQDLLRVRLHVAGAADPVGGVRVRHHRLHLLPAERRGLPVVSGPLGTAARRGHGGQGWGQEGDMAVGLQGWRHGGSGAEDM